MSPRTPAEDCRGTEFDFRNTFLVALAYSILDPLSQGWDNGATRASFFPPLLVAGSLSRVHLNEHSGSSPIP